MHKAACASGIIIRPRHAMQCDRRGWEVSRLCDLLEFVGKYAETVDREILTLRQS